MATWSNDELHKIAETDDLHISPFREDGMTYGTPAWIWSVVVDDNLYVRAYNGLPLVSVRNAAEGGTDHGCWHDNGSYLRASRWNDHQRSH